MGCGDRLLATYAENDSPLVEPHPRFWRENYWGLMWRNPFDTVNEVLLLVMRCSSLEELFTSHNPIIYFE